MAKAKTLWISYDLGLKGDYSGIYAWLDAQQAKECGDSLAVFKWESKGELFEEIRTELNKSIKLSASDRIYIIYRDDDTGHVKGKFINGGRKRAPWEGFAASVFDGGEDY